MDRVQPPPMQRALGRLELTCRSVAGSTRIGHLYETGGQRWRFPRRRDAALEAVQLNTGGGLAGGDTLDLKVTAGAGTTLVVSTQAAERVYRSLGPATRIDTSIDVAAGAALAWMPQETLLYDGVHLNRRTDVALAAGASLFICDTLVFGRLASGERLATGLIADRWRIVVAGRLTLIDPLRLEGGIDDLLGRPAIAAGARAVATLTATADISGLDSWRAAVEECGVRAAGGAVRGLLRARLFAATGGELKAALGRVLERLGREVPRVWRC